MDERRESGHGRRFLYAGIFLVAQAALMLEILLTRITSVVSWYHLAFFVIALAMLGMTAGAVVVFVRPGWFAQAAIGRRLESSARWGAIAAPLAAAWVMATPLMPVVDLMGFVALVGVGAALALPFGMFGVTLTLALTRAGLPPGAAYGVDLVGASLGCLLVIPLLDLMDAGSAALVASSLAALGAASFALAAGARGRALMGLVTACALVALAGLNSAGEPPALRPAWVKGKLEDVGSLEWIAWNTHSRIDISWTKSAPPMLWAAGRATPISALAPRPTRVLRIDGAAATPIVALGAGPHDHEYLDWDVSTAVHRLRPAGPAAVIGVGGGRDVLAALRSGHEAVVGIELNEAIVAAHQGKLADFSGISRLPGVRLVHDEARSFLSRDQGAYEVITMSLIDTWAATGAGAYSLSENGLYTTEAWEIFLRRLTPTGIFTVSRWYQPGSPGETARMIGLAMETLWRRGAADPLAHLAVLQQGTVATLLLSPSPLSAGDLDAMQREAALRGFNVLVSPRRRPANPLIAAVTAQKSSAALAAWAAEQTLDLSPPSDARPFFFNMLRPSGWLARREAVDALDLAFLGNLRATQTLVFATGVSLLLTLGAIVGPLWLRRGALSGIKGGSLAAACGYFALIGLGFMFVEMGLISAIGVFLGHPTLALAVVLGGIILATGCGSLLSGRVTVETGRWAWLYPLAPALLVTATELGIGPVTAHFVSEPTAVRVLVSLGLLAPSALAMGLCFPLGLRLVGRAASLGELGPWLWGLNGAFGVSASGLALGISMVAGIGVTMGLGALCYVGLLPCVWALRRA